MSSTPETKATFPVPSALNVPATATGPFASKPWKKNAYCPLSTDSWPVPQVIEDPAPTLSVNVCVAGVPTPFVAVKVSV